jgi:osmotically-inducible protein OsmY
VEKTSSRDLAKEVALSVEGVKDVDNQLHVNPKHQATATRKVKAAIKNVVLESKVKNQLLTEIGVNALKIEVEASNGVVSLRGTVPNAEVEKLAVRKAEHAGGVKKVIDLLKERQG